MENPTKNIFNFERLKAQCDIAYTKQFRQIPISQAEILRLKNSNVTPLPVSVMMSHITYECVGRPNRKLMQCTPNCTCSNSPLYWVVCKLLFVNTTDEVKFMVEFFIFSLPVFSARKITKHMYTTEIL